MSGRRAVPAADRSVHRLLASLFLTWTGFALTSVGAALLLVDRFGLGVTTGTALAVQVLTNVLVGPLVGDLVSRRAPRSLAIGSSLTGGLLVLGYPAAHTPGQAQLVAFLTGLAVLPGIPARMALRSALVPAASQHRVSGQMVAAERLALVLGPLAAGLLAARLGYPAVFYGEAVLAAAAAALLLRTPSSRRFRRSRPGPTGGAGPTDGRRRCSGETRC
ncbi:MFS transporter [Modestobacter sp. DSM 44400]|uniref:MFS transporter n=1 Tax=Modestobacter sp. DSM 44400 TaxID=1550230 RepID=UPI0015877CF8|nr:MFS transporter [Modestobacter sp. DSM 44400]